jgi:tRNA-specific 2-thiouridylase
MPEVAIALSGGVDSSVAAALLVEAGRDVVGVTMRLGLEAVDSGANNDADAVEGARRVCDTLGIAHVVVDVAREFRAEVVEPFCDAYASGRTPNPCVTCNQRIKFGVLAEQVRDLGATTLATGHYARLTRDGGGTWLERAKDLTKDQSYFLYRIAPEVLDTLEFPLGELTKSEVRRMAAERNLPTAERRESQEVCFAKDHVDLVAAAHPEAVEPGPIEALDGTVLGTHRGIARYTVGQRKGLGVSGPEGPYRVVRIDAARNAVVVAPEGDALTSAVTLTSPVWRLGEGPTRVLARVRYRSTPEPAIATYGPSHIEVAFDAPTGPLAPGQSVVLYRGDRVGGGGIV